MASEITTAYTAGILDGEGYIRMQKNHGLTLSVGSTSLELLEWLRDHWGGKIYLNRHNYPNSKPFFQWQLHGREAVALIELVVPYLIVKQKQAMKAIELKPLIGKKNNYLPGFNETCKVERHRIWQELKKLNRRGIVMNCMN